MNLKRLVSRLVGLAFTVMPIIANYPNNISDDEDDLFSGGGASSVDVTRWSVSEPYINLWLSSQPLSYETSYGATIGFAATYKQRNSRLNANMFGLGSNWECSWLTYVEYSLSGQNVTASSLWLPKGGKRAYTADGATRDFKSYSTMTVLRDGSNNVIGFRIDYPSGAKSTFKYLLNLSAGVNYASLSEDIDANGRTNVFQYETITGNIVRLVRMIDPDNRTNLVSYLSSTSPKILTVQSPYGRTAGFHYNANGLLDCITNVTTTMCDTFQYDSQGLVTSFITPYGTNSFVATTNSYGGFSLGGTNRINRSILVTEPDGRSKEMFLYRDQSTKLNASSSTDLLPPSYASGEVPVTSPLTNTFDNSYLDARNSFHWGKMQFEGLSTNFTAGSNFDNLSTNDYNLAVVKHWLRRTNDGPYVTDTLSLVRNASADGTNVGQKVWYDYKGKNGSQAWCRGTNAGICFEAVVLPDGTTRFKYNEQNRWGFPTKITTTYSSNSVVAQRSLTMSYATNDIDLVTMLGPSNELLSSNAYNSVHQMLTNYNAVNDLTTYTYDSGARLTSLKTPTGLTTTNLYYTTGTHVGWLQQTIDLEIARTNGFGYANGEASVHTNALGLVVTYARDSMDRPIEIHSTSLNITNVWDRLGLATTANSGSTNRYCYDEMQRVCATIDPRNGTNSFEYCGCGFLLTNTNPLLNISSFDHDFLSQRTSATLPDRQTVMTWNYDLVGQVTNMTIVGLTSVTNYYNNQGLLSVSSNALGQIESYQYDIYDRPTNVTDVNGITVQTTYDILGRVLTRTYPDTGVEKYAYSAAGVTFYTNQLGLVTKYGYDVAGRLTAVTNANNEVTRYGYDCEGNMTQLIDGKNRTNAFTFDIYSRLIRQTNAAGSLVLTNGYDLQGNLTKRWTPAKGLTTFAFDQSGNVTNVDYPSSHDLSFVYDEMNQLVQMGDSAGTTIFTYNENGELESEDGPWAADTVGYTYTNGLRKTMLIQQPNGPPATFTYGYDVASRLSSIASPFGTFGYEYQTTDSSNGKGSLIKKISHPNGTYVTNSFNNMGQLLATYLKNGIHATLNSHSYSNNVAGQRVRQTRTGNDYVDYTYDDIGQLKTAFAKESGGTTRLHEKFGYAYDAAGNLQYRTNNALVQTFGVDSLNQISSINRSGTLTVSGNSSGAASSVSVNGSSATLYGDNSFAKESLTITNGGNSFTATGTDSLGRNATNVSSGTYPSSPTMTYDNNGNLTVEGDRRYTYDDENQLVAFGYNGGTVTNLFAYDGRNRRRIRTEYTLVSGTWVKTAEVRYIYDGNLLIQERNTENLPVTTYTRGLDLSGSIAGAGGIGGLLARSDHSTLNSGFSTPNSGGPSTSFYHQDGNGNVTYLADQRQGLAAKYTYDPYGRVLAKSGPIADANRMQFSGKECDSASGLSYYGMRFYDPVLQRWLNQDPLGLAAGINLHKILNNDTINAIDALGMLDWSGVKIYPEPILVNTPIESYPVDRFSGMEDRRARPILAPGATSQELIIQGICHADSSREIIVTAFSAIRVLNPNHPYYRFYVPQDPTIRPFFSTAQLLSRQQKPWLSPLVSMLRFAGVTLHEQKHQQAFELLLNELKPILEEDESNPSRLDWFSCQRALDFTMWTREFAFNAILWNLNSQIETTGTFSLEGMPTLRDWVPLWMW